VLSGFGDFFPPEMSEHLIVGLDDPDDAAVYRIDENTALIFTADYFPPVVDDPYAYGAIAATNALSDVFAMGGRPALALNLASFPDDMPDAVARAILRGGAEKAREAGAVIAGGHTTRGEEPTYGLAVIGFVHPDALMRKGGARVGDRLYLSKALGVGVVTTAGKQGVASASDLEGAVIAMSRLNAAAAGAAQAAGVRCATDITGFGLLGHALEMAEASGMRFRVAAAAVPFLPGSERYGRAGCFPGGAARNAEHFAARVQVVGAIDEVRQRLLFSPETAGGLLAAVPAERAGAFEEAARVAGQPVWAIGEAVAGEGLELTAG